MTAGPNLFASGPPVQSLVYLFIALAGLGVGAAAYFGFTFSPIESFVTAIAFVSVAVSLLERTLRRRAEARLERAVEDLSRLLSTNAQAGTVLGQRINALVELDAGRRLDVVEADVSVLGTVVRQVAEAVADLDDARKRQTRHAVTAAGRPARDARPIELPATGPATPTDALLPASPADTLPVPPEPGLPGTLDLEPTISLEMLKQAIEEGRLVFHLQPVVTLPQRKAHGYDLVPRLRLDEGEFADPPDFMPKHGGEAVLRRIERLALEEAVTIARRARTGGQLAPLYVPVSRVTLVDAIAIDKAVSLLEANRAITGAIVLTLAETDWSAMPLSEKAALAAFVKRGVRLALRGVRSLRLDFADLAGDGVRSVRVDAQDFIAAPESFTDFHSSDVTSYVKRFEIDLVLTGVSTEEQVLVLLEDGVALVQGPHLAGPGPVRPDLVVERGAADPLPHRAQV
jgi:cyclic-di-GMP phosphodiesterase TipF (flagellum assembly factor)